MKCIVIILFSLLSACAENNNLPDASKNITEISMNESRASHTSTLLPSGLVLITGGFDTNGSALSSAEIFNPSNNTFTIINEMNKARHSHTATLLQNGNVLIAGGYNNEEYIQSAEIYNPVTGTFTIAGDMSTARYGHTATMLNNGNVFIAGGVGNGWTFLSSAELYDPVTGEFMAAGNMNTERESHTATLLNNGKVLITGGHKNRRSAIIIYSSAELYDPETGIFTAVGDMQIRRHKHDAVKLSDGRILISGGSDERDSKGQYNSTEIFDPNTNLFTSAGQMNFPRYKHNGTSVSLQDGKVILPGGANVVESYDSKENKFTATNINLGVQRLFASVVLLNNQKILLTGGYSPDITASDKAFLFKIE